MDVQSTGTMGSHVARVFWIAFGVVNHAVFAVTVWYLFWFLKGGEPTAERGWLWLDLPLALQFSVLHSVLLLPPVRQRLTRWIPSHSYGCFFCLASCLMLLLTMGLWQPSPIVVARFEGVARSIVEAGFFASWGLLFYALGLAGYGYQTGFTPWWQWMRGEPAPPRTFNPRGIFRFMRHPVYASFLGLIWFTPVITLDRALLIGVWTAYVFWGSYLKDQRLLHYLGDRYRDYQARVPGYPGFVWGPLARVKASNAPESAS